MQKIIFFSDSKCANIYPLNVGRCESTLHFGVRSVSQQWSDILAGIDSDIEINSRLMPTSDAAKIIRGMKPGDSWGNGEDVFAIIKGEKIRHIDSDIDKHSNLLFTESAADYFEMCGTGLNEDFEKLKLSWSVRTLSEEEREAWALVGVIVHGELDKIHLAPGAIVRSCNLNTEKGDVILGPNSEVMEGSNIRGPFVLGENSQLRMGSNVYGPTSIGKHCKVGGELSNVVIHDYSNKAHGGFLGNSVIGSWCNLGAETSASNLKNTYGEIEIYSGKMKKNIKSGRTFCGLLMGDHSKTAIHTAFDTATVVGAFCNIFGSGTPPKHIPSFSWGGSDGLTEYRLEQAISTAGKVLSRRGLELTPEKESEIVKLFSITEEERKDNLNPPKK
jgi:UDP-N-acetylglucosamine diphosphorylase/glucosamine-1-phosphate N-acetyltransferase